ncbi:MAG: hypothetical protein HOO99_18510 [Hyphomicrobiaceae bacterium]|nr:hypothetical protein [Hyphomicrobiaceae bacterium]
MRTKETKRRKKRSDDLVPARSQLSFDFGLKEFAEVETIAESRIEVLAPLSPTSDAVSAALANDGAEEHKFLVHQADKYEDRAFKALVALIAAASLTVMAKSGIPLPSAFSDKVGIPQLNNLRLLSGILAGGTIIFALALTYFALRIRQHSPQLKLRLVQNSIPGQVAQVLLWMCGLFLAAVVFAIVYISWRDIFYVMMYVVDRQRFVLDGWDPVKTGH